MTLVAYDEDGNVVGTLDKMVVRDEDGQPALIDFQAMEDDGLENTLVWNVADAVGSKVWRGEPLGAVATEYRVELSGPAGGKRIAAIVHRETGEDIREARTRPPDAPRRPSTLPLVGRRS